MRTSNENSRKLMPNLWDGSKVDSVQAEVTGDIPGVAHETDLCEDLYDLYTVSSERDRTGENKRLRFRDGVLVS